MTRNRRLLVSLMALAVAGLVSACQPLPHPFADDRPPAELLTMRDSIGVAIGPIDGGPPDSVDKLGPALASALLKRDIPASDRMTSTSIGEVAWEASSAWLFGLTIIAARYAATATGCGGLSIWPA